VFAIAAIFELIVIVMPGRAEEATDSAQLPLPSSVFVSGIAHQRGGAYGKKIYRSGMRDCLACEVYQSNLIRPLPMTLRGPSIPENYTESRLHFTKQTSAKYLERNHQLQESRLLAYLKRLGLGGCIHTFRHT
jgi:hypothetical protein